MNNANLAGTLIASSPSPRWKARGRVKWTV